MFSNRFRQRNFDTFFSCHVGRSQTLQHRICDVRIQFVKRKISGASHLLNGNVYYTFLAFCSSKNHVCTPILTRDMNFQRIQLGPSNIDLRELKIETY